ncbi:DUF2254 domain-containing protein [Rhodococcus erythropolis]|uniref:DUF2254 family protein n=1 Tax=Rhodococcus erythropolis TaxID=1833 RepID=UPI001E369A44|nr:MULTISPECIES: DUF2254 family protein [Rhodococcus erythropolis group]MCD2109092.1 DUF2254 domain-containing protein [Rhodococcus qingshengii]MCZ4528018.1 DUF2254 domain-containing protein [Rhodococcus erythropolis]
MDPPGRFAPTPIGHAFLIPRRRVRAGLTQILCVVVGLATGLLMPYIRSGPTIPARQVSEMLVALGLGLLGVVAVIFSLLFLVVQWAATTFTPRLLLFRDDPLVWRTFAFAIGQSVFDITAALAISSETDVSVVVPGLAVLALLATLTLIRLLQLRAFSAIQLAPVLASISSRGRAVFESVYPDTDRELPPLPTLPVITTIEWHRPPAVLQQILVEDLLQSARTCRSVVVLRVSPGTTLRDGLSLADVYGETIPADAILDALVSGSERTFTQDPILAIRLLADIALRALSPAINDPATAVQALDEIEDLLSRVAAIRADSIRALDQRGELRVVIPLPDFATFVRTGLDDVIASASNSPLVLDRLRELLSHVAAQSASRNRDILAARARWIDQLSQGFPRLEPPL